MKNYEVNVTAFARVLVIEAENEEKAMEYAVDCLALGQMQMDTAEIHCEVSEEELANSRRHADAIAEKE